MTKQNTPATIHPGQWTIKKQIARPANEYVLHDNNYREDKLYNDFEQFATQNSFPAPSLKDGIYEAEQLKFVTEIQHTQGWSILREEEVALYVNSNATTRIAITATPTEVKEPEESPLEGEEPKVGDIVKVNPELLSVNCVCSGKLVHISNKEPKYGIQFSNIGSVVYVDGKLLSTPTTLLSEGKNDFTPNDKHSAKNALSISEQKQEGKTVEEAAKEYGIEQSKQAGENKFAAKCIIHHSAKDFTAGTQWQSQHTAKEIEAKDKRIAEVANCLNHFINATYSGCSKEHLNDLRIKAEKTLNN